MSTKREESASCRAIEKHVGCYVDGELDAATLVEFDEHFEQCPPCRERLVFEVDSRALIRQALRVETPEGLEERVRGALSQAKPVQAPEPDAFGWRLMPAAAAAAALIFGGAAWMKHEQAQEEAALEDVVRVHTSGLPADVALDPAEPEADTRVSEWFRGRVAFPVRAAHFNSRDVRLVGARLSHVRERQAAALYYDIRGRRVTVVVTDAAVAEDAQEFEVGQRRIRYQELRGHRVPVRVEAGLSYAFTGDVDQETLLELAASAQVP